MTNERLLTLNAGSSSIKFAVYEKAADPVVLVTGQVEHIGAAARLIERSADGDARKIELGETDHAGALQEIMNHTVASIGDGAIAAVGHRVAHGGAEFTKPTRIDEDVIAKLKTLEPLAPLHQPHNLAAVEASHRIFPGALQVACFDTAFHRGHPWVNDTFAIPRAYYEKGVRRYGFHGLSYDYVTDKLKTIAPEIAAGRVIIAHLGNGASMCAVKDGDSVASTMGFSALDGLPMGTRCGQLDPGVLLYLLDHEAMSPAEITALLYKESGLKGLSGLTNDMRELEASSDPAAKQAIDYFVFRIRREVGAMAAVLGGIDALVFCGGIGENSATIRASICVDMEWLGVSLDEAANVKNALRINAGAVPIFVVPTDEERVIARALVAALKPGSPL